MSTVVGSGPDTINACGTVIEGEKLTRKLEKVFEIFCRAQEDWAMTHDPGQSPGGMETDADCSA
jgi:hypothetical protein